MMYIYFVTFTFFENCEMYPLLFLLKIYLFYLEEEERHREILNLLIHSQITSTTGWAKAMSQELPQGFLHGPMGPCTETILYCFS